MIFQLLFLAIEGVVSETVDLERNNLFPEYGVNFRYLGKLEQGLDRFTVVTQIPIPKFEELELRPPQRLNCSTLEMDKIRLRGILHTCQSLQPYVEALIVKWEFYESAIQDTLTSKLYSAIPELQDTKQRKKRGFLLTAIGGLITLAVETVSSWIRGNTLSAVTKGVHELRTNVDLLGENYNQLKKFSKEKLLVGKYSMDTLNSLIETTQAMHKQQTGIERLFHEDLTQWSLWEEEKLENAIVLAVRAMLYYSGIKEEHQENYELTYRAATEMLESLRVLMTRHLPRAWVTEDRIAEAIQATEEMLKENFEGYTVAITEARKYYDMALATVAVDKQTHSLIVSYPIFIKPKDNPKLSLFETEFTFVPIRDENDEADSFTLVTKAFPYVAIGKNESLYVTIRQSEFLMCKSISFEYFCEEMFIIRSQPEKHCSSAILLQRDARSVMKACDPHYFFNITPPATILDGDGQILLANFKGETEIACQGKRSQILQGDYVVLNREILCDCDIFLPEGRVLKRYGACQRNANTISKSKIRFVNNKLMHEALKHTMPKRVEHFLVNYEKEPQKFEFSLKRPGASPMANEEQLQDFCNRWREATHENIDLPDYIPSHSELPIFRRTRDRILILVTGGMSLVCSLAMVYLIYKHCHMQGLLAAVNTQVAMTEAQGIETVNCKTSPITWVTLALAILGLLVILWSKYGDLQWLRGFQFRDRCQLYIFLHDDRRYFPIKIRDLSGPMTAYFTIGNPKPEQVIISKGCFSDTIILNRDEWGLYNNETQPVRIPMAVSVAWYYRLGVRQLITNQNHKCALMLRQGHSWVMLDTGRDPQGETKERSPLMSVTAPGTELEEAVERPLKV